MGSTDALEAEKNAAESETIDSNDLSTVFLSQYNTKSTPLENKKILGIIENFVILFKRTISGFLGKKIEFVFDRIEFVPVDELNIDKSACVLSSILLKPLEQLGLIYFDYPFVHTIIDILFGAGIYKSDTVITSLGKSGGTIAKKIVELCVASLQEAILEYETVQITPLKTTEQHGLILNQPLPDQFFKLAFHADFNGLNCEFYLAFPALLFENMMLEDHAAMIEHQDFSTVNVALKKDIIDSTVTLIASLKEVKLNITDIMNLKSGDLIPIDDPTLVYISHEQKKMFKASVGQSNSVRVIKILDTL